VSFKQLADHELDKLSDEALIAYLRDARSAGAKDTARRALAVLVYGYEDIVEQRMALRLPAHAVQDAAHEALVRAVASAFDSSSVGEFRSWLGTIVKRTIADWYRRRERRPEEVQLPREHSGDERPEAVPAVASETGAVEFQMVVDDVMAKLSDSHREVIELHVFEDIPATEVCGRIDGMSADNVAQIASRFRKRLREALATGSEESAA
jgi:RNA polymerase sigma factor (sigma-70 family)